jgi:hypothetical protein
MEPTQGEVSFLSMGEAFPEAARLVASGGHFIEEILFVFQNGEIEVVALAVVEAIDDIALLARELKMGLGFLHGFSGLAQTFGAFIAVGFKHGAEVLLLKHLHGRESGVHRFAPIGQMFGEQLRGFVEGGFGFKTAAQGRGVSFECGAGGAFADGLHGLE